MTSVKRRERENAIGTSKAKRKTQKYSELAGCLTARSHLLHSDPECIILEICSAEASNYVLCRPEQLSVNYFNIGRCYKFQYLQRGSLILKGGKAECYKVTDLTVIEETILENAVYHPPYLENLTVVMGEVSEVNPELGICHLGISKMVIFSTCSRVACVPMPTKSQIVKFFNVHRVKEENGVTIYAMCVKSFMSIEGEDDNNISPSNLSPLLLTLGDALRDYRLILVLRKCSTIIQENFCNSFLQLHGIAEIDCKEFRSCLLQSIAKFWLKSVKVERMSTIEEFIATDHKFQCGVVKEVTPLFHLCSLRNVNERHPDLVEEANEDGEIEYWQYDVKKDTMNFLIGMISFKTTNFRLTLNDAFCSTPCLVLCHNREKMITLQKKIVLVTEHNFVRERFSISGGNTPQSMKYLIVPYDKVCILSTVETQWKNQQTEEMHSSRPSGLTSSVNAPKILNETRHKDTILIQSFSPAGKKNSLHSYLSQLVFVQTKSSLVIRKDKLTPRCYLLVTLIGEMTRSSSGHHYCNQENESKRSIFICLENSLLRVHPFINVNSVLEIRFPLDFNDNFFKKGSPLSFVEGLVTMLPTICCVTLPATAEVHLVNNNVMPSDSIKFRDCYRIQQSLEEANYKELIDIIGYVVGRYHQDPKYAREKTSLQVNGFGVADNKVIAVILRDTPPESQTGMPVTLYMSNSVSPTSINQYPQGLVLGAKAIFRFVVKVKPSSKASGVYFRSSLLTSVEIIDVVKSERNNEDEGLKDLWGLRELLPSVQKEGNLGCSWISVSMAHLVKVSINATCASCKYPVKNKVCTFVGCSARAEISIYSQATLLINEFGAKPAYVFVPDSLVSKLFQDHEGCWGNVVKLAQFNGQLHYSASSSSQDTSLSLEERVFIELCRCILQGKRFHLLCRQFRKKGNLENPEDTSTLYAVDLSSVSMVMAAS